MKDVIHSPIIILDAIDRFLAITPNFAKTLLSMKWIKKTDKKDIYKPDKNFGLHYWGER